MTKGLVIAPFSQKELRVLKHGPGSAAKPSTPKGAKGSQA